jgi:RimJ/RimL family protein N-acetyltransferase
MTTSIPCPAYRIVTPRLVIRCWDPSDAPLLKAAIDANLEHLYPWMTWVNQEPTDLQTKIETLRRFRGNFDMGKDLVYGIFNPAETEVWGGTGLHPRVGHDGFEIGYWIHKDQVRKGLASEAAAALTRVALEVNGMRRIEIHCALENEASAGVARKLGYHLDGALRKRLKTADGLARDEMAWTMLADEYPGSVAATLAANIEAYDAIGRRIL